MTVLADRVRETTTTTGTGAVTLAGATTGYRAFSAEVAVAGTVFYCITDGTNWETGLGTLATATTLARTAVYESSNAGALVSFPAGAKDVFCTIPASQFLPVHADLGASIDLDDITVSGVYCQPSNANTSLVLNYPVAVAGRLDVFSSGRIGFQKYTAYDTSVVYSRSRHDSTWYPWKKLVSTDSPTFTGTVLIPTGTAALPSLAFSGDTNTGLHSPGAGQLSLVTGGVSAMDISSAQNVTFSGRIGVGTAPYTSIGVGVANAAYADSDLYGSRSQAYSQSFGRDDSASIYLETDREHYGAYNQVIVSDQNWHSYITGAWTPFTANSYGAYNGVSAALNSGTGFSLNGENNIFGSYNYGATNSDHSVFNRYEGVYGAYNYGYSGGDAGYSDNLYGSYNYATLTGSRPTFTGSIASTVLTITAFANSATINQLSGGCILEAETGSAVTSGTTITNQLTSDAKTFTVEGSHPSALANAALTVTVPSTTGMKVGQSVFGHPLDANGVPTSNYVIGFRSITALTATTMTLSASSTAIAASDANGCGYTVYWGNYFSVAFASGGAIGESSFEASVPSSGLLVGMLVSGVGLPLGTTVTNITISGTSTTYTFSNAFTKQATGTYYAFEQSFSATATGGASGGDEITFATTEGISKGLMVSGTGVPAGTFVKWRTLTSIRLSNSLTSTASGSYAFRIAGKTGTYTVSASQTVASQSILGTALKAGNAFASYNYLNIDYSRVTSGYGSKNIINVDSSSILGSAYGCTSEITNSNELTTAYGFNSNIDNAAGTLTTAYLYKGIYDGTIGTKWGLHFTGETKSYLSGGLLVGSGVLAVEPPAGSVIAAAGILSAGPTSGIGYTTGAGGTVVQSTSKSTTVTLDKVCGTFTMHPETLAADTTVSFVFSNSAISVGDVLAMNHVSSGTYGAYSLNARSGPGFAYIDVRNVSAAPLSEPIVVGFVVLKAVTA
jgi:hypothetical protein